MGFAVAVAVPDIGLAAHMVLVWHTAVHRAAGDRAAGIAYTDKPGQRTVHKAVGMDTRPVPVPDIVDTEGQQAYPAALEFAAVASAVAALAAAASAAVASAVAASAAVASAAVASAAVASAVALAAWLPPAQLQSRRLKTLQYPLRVREALLK